MVFKASNTIQIKVIPNAKKNSIVKFGNGLKVYLTAPPTDGKANKALLKMLAQHFNLKKSQLSIIKGERSGNKVVKMHGFPVKPGTTVRLRLIK